MHERAGTVALPEDLIDVDELISAYYRNVPDVTDPAQRVAFGTSGHRGSSLKSSFTETHILAVTQAICEYRAEQGITGPLLIGRDTHALSDPAEKTALDVLVANGVEVLADADGAWVPTPSLSRAIVAHNADPANERQADGIIITPSHNPPQDGGFKYNPPHGGPADTDATSWIEDRANELIAAGNVDVRRENSDGRVGAYDFMGEYVRDLASIIDFEAIQRAGVRIGADPLGGSSVRYWQAIADAYGIDLTVVNPEVDAR
ncbi:MAG: phosphoglucomutase, alpha-D-glucose phosphate-specific, partial [Microbacteriaceae bacterium]|nr:phosphoglucomutase, alpha-D-glucose phosphate-specific [Microbacteriaceae bacterium]